MKTQSRLLVVGIVVLAAMVGLTLLRVGQRGFRGSDGLQAAFDAEFLTRPDGYPGLREHYGLSFSRPPRQMDPGLMYRAIADGAVDVIDGFATDGRIPAYGLVVLDDDKAFFPPYFAAPVIRAAALERWPELRTLLNRLGGLISNETMQRLNFEADEKGRKAEAIAREFLLAEGLLDAAAERGSGEDGKLTVGSKHFTEQEILGEMIALLIEHNTDIRVVRKLNLGGTMICFSALRAGDLDVYAEYTGTGLVNILDEPVIADPEAAYDRVARAFSEQYGLVWLEPFGFNNTYTLTMRADQATALGIETISDLAAHLRQ